MSPRDILSFLFNLYIAIVLLRFLLQWMRTDFYNPLSQFILKMTQPVLVPLRRVIPGFGGIDWASLLFLLALLMLRNWLLGSQMMFVLGYWLALPFDALLLLLNTLIVCLFGRAILSWVDPHGQHPFQRPLAQLTDPLLRPIRRLMPSMGGLDLSPMFAILGLYLLIWCVHELAALL